MSVLSELTQAVRSALETRIRAGSNLDVQPILNWGGFVNRSFHIRTFSGEYHLKLTCDAEVKTQLQQWWSVREMLEHRYHAPRMLDWFDVGGTGYSGPLFEWVSGISPGTWSGEHLRTMSDLLRRLHADEELAAKLLDKDAAVRTCSDVYLATFHQRFTEDLKGISAARPPFVRESRLEWMQREVSTIEAQVRKSGVFDEIASSPTHGDVWLNNILVTGAGLLYLLDWDELALGDPVMDWAMLYGPTRIDTRPVTLRYPALDGQLDAAGAERLQIWGRASLLDWIIDPLADWVEAASEPEHGPEVRAAAEIVHERALEQYLALWG